MSTGSRDLPSVEPGDLLSFGSLQPVVQRRFRVWLAGVLVVMFAAASRADEWPELPSTNGSVEIPAQEWPQRPGSRTVKLEVHYPAGTRDSVQAQTGIFLSLHNWGGSGCIGTANPDELAARCDCVAVCVDYLQSGPKDSIEGPEPYDFGWLQGLDAIRALYAVWNGLRQLDIPFDDRRLYATGGSGGGNVSLMANKLAPRTFTAVIDLCGMPKLSDDIAFHLPGGSELNARYRRDPAESAYLSRDAQEVRFIGHPQHLEVMRALGTAAQIHIVHGAADTVCPIGDARELIANMQAARLNVVPRIVEERDLDGRIFASTGHSLGDRTAIVFAVAGDVLTADGPRSLRRQGPTDFERRDESVRYRTARGTWTVSYRQGFPVGSFHKNPQAPNYSEHLDLTYFLDNSGGRQRCQTPEDWAVRRNHVVQHFERVAGEFPGPAARVPLELEALEESRVGHLTRRKVRFRSDHESQVTAWLFLPPARTGEKRPAVLCLQQTTAAGKDEPAGLAGDPSLHYALELAQRGFITLAPDYPSFGEYAYDFAQHPQFVSGTMKAIWDNVRAIDVLESLEQVDRSRIGCLGHSLGGHNAIFTALFEPRLQAVVSSCGFCTFTRDDLPSWTGPRYLPRIAGEFGNEVRRVPFDFPELIAAIAPRPFLACAATRDDDFDVAGVRVCLDSAGAVYRLLGVPERLEGYYPDAVHSFPAEAREAAYRFLERHLAADR